MFKKKPLYKAKQNTLKSGVDLINAQSKSMYELFQLINAQITELNGMNISKASLLENNTLSEIEKSTIRDELRKSFKLQARMESLDINLTACIRPLVEGKDKIISINNSSHSDGLFVLNPFSDSFPIIRNYIPAKFFSREDYLEMENKRADFERAHLNLQHTLSFRRNAAGALMASLFLVSVASMLAFGVALSICVNPIAGVAICGLTAAFGAYYLQRFERDYMSWVEHLTKIDEKIYLDGSDESLFPGKRLINPIF